MYLSNTCAGLDTSCNGHGTYQHDTCSCLCDPGWEGPDCSVSTCPDFCNDNGRCVDGKCVCHEGYTGDDCSQLTCPDNCNDKGHCVDGKCVCFPHFTGENCDIQKCPNDCIGNGQCVDGRCICDEGFYGEDCSSGNSTNFMHTLLLSVCQPTWRLGKKRHKIFIRFTFTTLFTSPQWSHWVNIWAAAK